MVQTDLTAIARENMATDMRLRRLEYRQSSSDANSGVLGSSYRQVYNSRAYITDVYTWGTGIYKLPPRRAHAFVYKKCLCV